MVILTERDVLDIRNEWEYEVTVTKRLGKWEANDGDDYEVAETAGQAVDDLWEMVQEKICKEYCDIWVETKWEEQHVG